MSEAELSNLLPTMKDLIVPAIIGAALWLARKVLPVVSDKLHKVGKRWIISDLRKIRSIRRCPFAIQRQIAKEGALFNAFLTITVIMLGALMLLSRQNGIQRTAHVLQHLHDACPSDGVVVAYRSRF